MQLPKLFVGTLVRRYKRFLADIIDSQGQQMTLHCPNTGAMTGCVDPGSRIYYSRSENRNRKYPCTLEFVDTDDGLVSVNTARANSLVGEALVGGSIGALQTYSKLKPEVKIPEGNGRFDFLASTQERNAYIEVKSVTLHVGNGQGAFPDAVSERARKHVDALVKRVEAGDRGVLIFCAQHLGLKQIRPAEAIDPAYAQTLEQAMSRGVEVLAYSCTCDLQTMQLGPELKFALT
jgi:sugar fermentation stimulation protein A